MRMGRIRCMFLLPMFRKFFSGEIWMTFDQALWHLSSRHFLHTLKGEYGDSENIKIIWGRLLETCGQPRSSLIRRDDTTIAMCDFSLVLPRDCSNRSYLYVNTTNNVLNTQSLLRYDTAGKKKKAPIWPNLTPKPPRGIRLLGDNCKALAINRPGWLMARNVTRRHREAEPSEAANRN